MSEFMIKGRQYLEFNGQSSKDFYLYITGPGVYDSPSPDVDLSSIPGLNGDLVQNNARTGQRRFSNVNVKYEAFFMKGLPIKTMAIKSWLLSPTGYCLLKDTYDPDFFRMGICTQALTFDVTHQKAAQMDLTFNCKPQRWSVEGQKAVHMEEHAPLRNPYDFYAEPMIRVYGEGDGVLYIGDQSVTIYSIRDYVDLNCETQNAYNASGFCNDLVLSEDFPSLAPGTNQIAWSGGITAVEITPQWWTL